MRLGIAIALLVAIVAAVVAAYFAGILGNDNTRTADAVHGVPVTRGPPVDVTCTELSLNRQDPHRGQHVRLEAWVVNAEPDTDHPGQVIAGVTCGVHGGRMGQEVGMVRFVDALDPAALAPATRVVVDGYLLGRVNDRLVIDEAHRLPDATPVLPQDWREGDIEGPIAGGSTALHHDAP